MAIVFKTGSMYSSCLGSRYLGTQVGIELISTKVPGSSRNVLELSGVILRNVCPYHNLGNDYMDKIS